MSWCVMQTEGTPDAVAADVQRQFDCYGASPSKEEFAEALPHLLWMVRQVSGHNLRFSAGGSKSTTESSLYIKMDTLYS